MLRLTKFLCYSSLSDESVRCLVTRHDKGVTKCFALRCGFSPDWRGKPTANEVSEDLEQKAGRYVNWKTGIALLKK
jgi:hypothetical protein